MSTLDSKDRVLNNYVAQQANAAFSLNKALPRNEEISIARILRENILSIFTVDDVIRFFDIIISLLGLILLLPLLLLVAFIVKVSSRGPVIFTQKRVGKDNTEFKLYKFRTMQVESTQKSSLTIGNRDKRITAIGYFLRKYKLDELPQLYNVLKNEMSIVGPRPEVRKYVNLYSGLQREILLVKPGITDYASILFRNENELLAAQAEPEKYYIETIMRTKIRINKKYASNKTLKNYFIVIFWTAISVFK